MAQVQKLNIIITCDMHMCGMHSLHGRVGQGSGNGALVPHQALSWKIFEPTKSLTKEICRTTKVVVSPCSCCEHSVVY